MLILKLITSAILLWSAYGDYEYVTKLQQPLDVRIKCWVSIVGQLGAVGLMFL